ncbi:hypothetical protein ACLB2K_052794 [Fragaria x ananassa]
MMMSSLLAFLLLSNFFFAAALAEKICAGCFLPIDNVSDPNLRVMAEFAISQYNKMQSEPRNHLVFRNLVRAESQVVGGTNFELVIAAVNQSSSPSTPQNYKARVYVDLWETQKMLVSFTLGLSPLVW